MTLDKQAFFAGVAVYMVYHKEYLFQLLFNFVSFAAIDLLFTHHL